MVICSVEDCPKDATKKCSGCKTAWYCGAECQARNWPLHKKECKEKRKQQNQEEEELGNPPPKPRTTHCTGCNTRFRKDDVDVDQECPDCGYITCESCSCHETRGTCYCERSNFGYPYCIREPQWYLMGKRSGKLYKGDFHPGYGYTLSMETHPGAFEIEPRKCNNCGEVVRCLKKEYCEL